MKPTEGRSYRRAAVLAWLLCAGLLAALALGRWPAGEWLKTDFMALLPGTGTSAWQQRASAAQAAAYDRQLVLRVQAADRRQAAAFLQQVLDALARADYLEADVRAAQAARWRELAGALHPYRWSLLTGADQRALEDDPGAYLERFRSYLYSPLGGAALNNLPGDPLGTFRHFVAAAAPPFAGGEASDGGDRSAMTTVSLRPERMALPQLEELYDLYNRFRKKAVQQQLQFQATGAPLYSAYGIHSARREISTIGLASLGLLVAMLLATLRSARALLLTLVCVASGVATGLLATVTLLGQVHLLALVFGATLIGIAADYALHFLAHSLDRQWRRERSPAPVLPALSLGAASSVIAFGALALLPFPGVRQIGLFMAAGLAGSFATVCLLFPGLYTGAPRASLPAFCARSRLAPGPSRRWLAAAALLCLPGLWLLQGEDDVRDFYAAPAGLKADEAAIAGATSQTRASRYLLLEAESLPALLAREEALRSAAPAHLHLAGISNLVPSPAQQRRNLALLRQVADSGQLERHLEELGLAQPRRRAILAEIRADQRPLSPDALAGLDLPLGTGGLLGCDPRGCASRLQIAGSAQSAELDRLAARPGVTLVDPIADINRLMQHYRGLFTWLLPCAALAAAALLTLVAGWRRALGILILPACACLFSLGLLGYLTGSVSLINLLGLLLILGVGLDYAVFRAYTPEAAQGATTLAITLSALTSVLAFGMLAFSATPVISAFGQTIALGLVAAYGLSWLHLSLHSTTPARGGQ